MDLATFNEKFHSLEGRTVGEKQRNLNILLKNLSIEYDQLSLIKPKNSLEKFFKLKLLLKLKRSEDLLQILKTEEEYLVAKLVRHKWFCQDLASNLDENRSNFVNDVLPSLSFVIRKRLLIKLATFGTNLDEIFDQICGRYGLHVATNVLVGCSSSKIESVFNENNVILTCRQLKILWGRHPQLFVLYGKNEGFKRIHESCFKYIARNDVHNFIQLAEEFGYIGVDFGKRLTRRIVALDKDSVIANTNRWNNCLHLKTVAKILTPEELYKFVYNYCGPTFDVDPDCGRGLDYNALESGLGSKYYHLVGEVVRNKYNKSIYDLPDLITGVVMETMDVEELQKWVAIKKQKGASENELLPFMRITDAISFVKDKFNAKSSREDRDELVQLLVKACKVNNDLEALMEVGRHICTREDLTSFLKSVGESLNMDKFEENHWTFIDEILENFQEDYEEVRYDFYVKKMEFLFRTNKLSDDELFKFLKVLMCDYRWKFQTKFKELNKTLLIKSIDFVPKIYSDRTWEYVHIEVLKDIFKWNKNNPKNRISVLEPSLIKSLKKSMDDARNDEEYIHDLGSLTVVMGDFICTEKDSEVRNAVLECYFALSQDYYDFEIDYWLLRHQPYNLTFFEKFLDHLFYRPSRAVALLNYAKSYASLEFQRGIVKRALEIIEENEDTNVACAALAILNSSEEFLEHIAPFYPSFDKLEDVDYDKSGSIAISIAKSFKYATSSLVIPVLLSYCKGDFLKHALNSLYYLFSHLPEEELRGFFNEESMRKYSLSLACGVGDVAVTRHLLKRFTETEENVPRDKILRASLKYFVKNPTEEFWYYVKAFLQTLNKIDHATFQLVVDIQKIPEKCQARYIIFAWDILKKGENSEMDRTDLLTYSSPKVHKDLPLEFISSVIKENFLSGNLEEFIASCLTDHRHKSEVMTTIFEIIQRTDFTDLCKERVVAKTVFNFVEVLVRSVEKDVGNLETLRSFVEKWRTIFSPIQAMRQHLKLSFAIIYLEANKDLGVFSARVAQFFDDVVAMYGVGVVDVFAEETEKCLKNILSSSEFGSDFYAFCKNVMAEGGPLHRVLVIKLLPPQKPSIETTELLQFVKFLRSIPEDSVQMLLNLYIMKLEGNQEDQWNALFQQLLT